MRPTLELVEDNGAHITSSLVKTQETALGAYITFIQSTSLATHVGLGNYTTTTFPAKTLDLTSATVLPLQGLPQVMC